MTRIHWTDQENDLVVADYFAMLAEDNAGQRPDKTQHRRSLLPLLSGRSESAVEFKHQNISGVLKALGEVWLPGYPPAVNFQKSLVDAVARWLALRPEWIARLPVASQSSVVSDTEALFIGPPPTLSNRPPPKDLEQMLAVAQKFDVAGRDARNRALGRAGEARVVAHERAILRSAGRDDLARRVAWVSAEEGDGAGYDISSFDPNGRLRLIEVKTTNGWERTPFYISRNEVKVAEDRRNEWCLVRLWNFNRDPQAFELRPPLDAHVSLTATAFEARLH